MRQAIEDARLWLGVARLALKDALIQTWRLIKEFLVSAPGSIAIVAAVVGLVLPGAASVTATTVAGRLWLGVLHGVFVAAVIYNLPQMRKIRTEIDRMLYEQARRHAEALGYFRGYDEGWRNASKVRDYYTSQGYHIRDVEPDD